MSNIFRFETIFYINMIVNIDSLDIMTVHSKSSMNHS